MIKIKQQINLADSLSPWDIQELSPRVEEGKKCKKQGKGKIQVKSRYQLKRDDLLRNKTAQKSQKRSFIKLQARIPTQVFTIDHKNHENDATNMNIVVKLPNQFEKIQQRKMPQRSVRPPSLSQRDVHMPRQKASMRNFMQQIQELDKLKLRRKQSRQTLVRGQSQATLYQSSKDSIIKKCSLKNLHMFNQQTEFTEKLTNAKSKLQSKDKKHILDRILTRFQ